MKKSHNSMYHKLHGLSKLGGVLLLFLTIVDGAAGQTISSSTLSGTDTSAVTGSVMQTPSGATWTTGAGNGSWIYTSDGMAAVNFGTGETEFPSSAGQPSSNSYDVQADFKYLSAPTGEDRFGIVSGGTTANITSGYFGQFFYQNNAWYGNISWGYNTALVQTTIPAPVIGTTYHVKLTRRLNATTAANSDLALYITRSADGYYLATTGTWQSASTAFETVANDSHITMPGLAGIWSYNTSSGTGSSIETGSTHVANFVASGPNGATSTPAFTLSPTTATTSTSQTETVTGTNTAWTSATTFSVSGGTGASISAAAVNTTAQTATFTLVPGSAAGTLTIADSTDAATATVAVSAAAAPAAPMLTIPVNSPAFRASPGNSVGDTGRNSGSAYRQWWNVGGYFTAVWTTNSTSPTANILFNETGLNTNAQISYFVDGVLTDNVAIPSSTGTGSLAVSGLSGAGTHTLTAYIISSAAINRFGSTNTNVVRVTGLQVDSGGAAGVVPASPGWVQIVGDSTWEGIGVGDWLYDTSAALGFGLKAAYGYDFCLSACGNNGWLSAGDNNGDVPPWYAVSSGVYSEPGSRWDKVDATYSVLDSSGQISAYGQTGTLPAAIIVNLTANEALHGLSTSDTTAAVTGYLKSLHQGTTPAAPGVPVMLVVSPGMYNATVFGTGLAYVNALKAGLSNYQAAYPADTKVSLIDLGPSVSNALASTPFGAAVHYNQAGHAFVAPQLLAAIQKKLSAIAPATSILYTGGQIKRGR